MPLPKRVWVVGGSGSGKTTVARRIAGALGTPLTELDALHHQAEWQPLPTDQYRVEVAALAARDRWVIDGNYRHLVGDLITDRADTTVWLDLPRSVVMRRIVGRTFKRRIRNQELWNGNRERWSAILSLDPERNMILWSWTQHGVYRSMYEGLVADLDNGHLDVKRLTTVAQVEEYVRSLELEGRARSLG